MSPWLWHLGSFGVVSLALASAGLTSGCGNQATSGGSGGDPVASGGTSAGSGGASPESGGISSESGGAASGATDSPVYLKASNTDASDLFGVAAALSADGNTLVVGANREASSGVGVLGNQTDNSILGAGAVYVFSRNGSSWQQQAYLKASNSGEGDAFGTSLALSTDGNILAIGAPLEASAAVGIDGDEGDDSAENAGAVYLFVRSGGSWQQEAYLKASSSDPNDFFGISLALSADGSLLAVGAEGEDGTSSGIDGDETDKTAYESGAVYVFEKSSTSWQQRHYLKASNAGVGDHFGGSVALSAEGDLLAVGAYWEDSAASGIDGDQEDDSAGSAGAVYVFGNDGSTWQQEAYLKGSAEGGNAADSFGAAVSLSADGDTLAIGAVGDPVGTYAGAVYLFGREGASWQEAAYLKASNTGAGDEFGYHLQLSADGQTLAVGAAIEASSRSGGPSDDSAPEAGAAYVFGREGTSWHEQAFIKAPNADAADRFGWSVALSADGDVLAVGASRESSAATGVNGDQSDNSAGRAGAVYVYEGSALVAP